MNIDEVVVDLTPEGLGPWSSSKLKMLRYCPLQFFLKYVIKQKPKHAAPDSVITHIGSAAHRILEHVMLGKETSKAYALTRAEFAEKIPQKEWEENVETLELNINTFKQKIDSFGIHNPIKRVYTELKIGITRDYQPTGFFGKDVFFRGVIDLIVHLENDDVLIIDHKTGQPAVMGIKHNKDQLDTYFVLYNYGVRPINGGRAFIHFIRDGETKPADPVTKEEIETKLRPELEFSIRGAIDSVEELGYFKHIRSSKCNYCDFNTECKAGELKELEKKTVMFFKK